MTPAERREEIRQIVREEVAAAMRARSARTAPEADELDAGQRVRMAFAAQLLEAGLDIPPTTR